MSKLTFFQQDVMQKIAEIPDIGIETPLHISRRKYHKDNRRRDYEWGYTEPIDIDAVRSSANALQSKGVFTIDWRQLFFLTNKGIRHIDEMRAL